MLVGELTHTYCYVVGFNILSDIVSMCESCFDECIKIEGTMFNTVLEVMHYNGYGTIEMLNGGGNDDSD